MLPRLSEQFSRLTDSRNLGMAVFCFLSNTTAITVHRGNPGLNNGIETYTRILKSSPAPALGLIKLGMNPSGPEDLDNYAWSVRATSIISP